MKHGLINCKTIQQFTVCQDSPTKMYMKYFTEDLSMRRGCTVTACVRVTHVINIFCDKIMLNIMHWYTYIKDYIIEGYA